MAEPDGEVVIRTLDDGREFKIIKHFYSADELEQSLAKNGFEARVLNTPTNFHYVVGEKLKTERG